MVEIYTDGSCKNNPGVGGFGYLVYQNGNLVHAYVERVDTITTNNIMEMEAVLAALKYIHYHQIEFSSCKIYTDSQYVKMGILNWSNNWIKNNWCTSENKPVLNKQLWQSILALYDDRLQLEWVRAHTMHTDIHSQRNAYIDLIIR